MSVNTSQPTSSPTVFISSLEPGYWRVVDEALSTIPCPYVATSCVGGKVSAEYLCADGFFGPLCAVPEEGYYLDWTHRDALPCSQQIEALSIFIAVLSVMCLLIFVCRYIGSPGRNTDEGEKRMSKRRRAITRIKNSLAVKKDQSDENAMNLLIKLKIVIASLQVNQYY